MTINKKSSHHDDSYCTLINKILKPLIPSSAALALFDFPNHSNVGDSAIWLGQKKFLETLEQNKIVFNDTRVISWTPNIRLPEGTVILIHGGGNFGDLYPIHQKLRLHLANKYRQHRIIQLPQSIHFDSTENLEETSIALNSHPDFHLLVRDLPSLEIAKKLHRGNSQLCPDMALYLKSVVRPSKPKHQILALLRTDKEKKYPTNTAQIKTVFSTDWVDEPMTQLIRWTNTMENIHSCNSRWLKFLFRYKHHLYHRVAMERMQRGCELLSSGKVVITDRLHAHILCSLMSIPHVVLDNSYRKIGNFMDAWQTGAGLCKNAESFDQAVLIAREMLDGIEV